MEYYEVVLNIIVAIAGWFVAAIVTFLTIDRKHQNSINLQKEQFNHAYNL